MPKRKEPELDPAEQYRRFREAAEKAEVVDDERAFERAFKAVAPRRSAPKRATRRKATKRSRS